MKTTVRNFNGKNGVVKNQFIIENDNEIIFQSYDSVIAIKEKSSGKITLDAHYWDYSNTTGKYRNLFLGEEKKETEKKIAAGTYTLANLN